MYYYIMNPANSDDYYASPYSECVFPKFDDSPMEELLSKQLLQDKRNSMNGFLQPNCVQNLELLNQVDDDVVLFVETIMSNVDSFNSEYQKYDIDLLLTVEDKDIIRDLFKLMTNKVSLLSPYHRKDAELISQTTHEYRRKLLLQVATNKNNVKSENHEYDMNYILKLDLDKFKNKDKIEYYLFDPKGINDTNHVSILEKLYYGSEVDPVLDYLDNLEKTIDIDTSVDTIDDNNGHSKKLSIFQKIFRNKNNSN